MSTGLHPGRSHEHWYALHLHAAWERLPGLLAAVAPAAGRAEKWFFIFYGEGGPHLRLRMWLPGAAGAAGIAGVLAAVQAAAADAGCSDVRPEPYERELARYGGAPSIAAAEAVFEASSDLAVHVHAESEGRAGARLGWGGLLTAAAFAGLHGHEALAAAAAAHARYAARVVASLGAQLPSARPVEPAVAARWLRLGGALAAGTLAGAPAPAVAYAAALRRHIDHLREHPAAGDPPRHVLASHVHMTCNRLGLSVVDEHVLCAALAATGDDRRDHLADPRSLHDRA